MGLILLYVVGRTQANASYKVAVLMSIVPDATGKTRAVLGTLVTVPEVVEDIGATVVAPSFS